MVCEVTAIIFPFPATDKRFLDELASSLFFFFFSFFPVATYGLSPVLRLCFFSACWNREVIRWEARAPRRRHIHVPFFPIVTELCSKCLKQCDELRDDLASSLLWQASFPATTYKR